MDSRGPAENGFFHCLQVACQSLHVIIIHRRPPALAVRYALKKKALRTTFFSPPGELVGRKKVVRAVAYCRTIRVFVRGWLHGGWGREYGFAGYI